MHWITAVVLGPTTVNSVGVGAGNEVGGGVVSVTGVMTDGPTLRLVVASLVEVSTSSVTVVFGTMLVTTLVNEIVSVVAGLDEVVVPLEDGKEQM
jgi:hypothetical protein